MATVLLIGLGVVGLGFSEILARLPEPHRFFVVADAARQKKWVDQGLRINGREQKFQLLTPENLPAADVILIATKAFALEGALHDIRSAVRPSTILVSLLNGLSSEQVLRERYSEARVVTAVAQGMDGVREGGDLNYKRVGEICFGPVPGDGAEIHAAVQELLALFSPVGLPFTLKENMLHHL